jgi:hypothetical protein
VFNQDVSCYYVIVIVMETASLKTVTDPAPKGSVLNFNRSENEKFHKVNGFRCHTLSLESHGILKNIRSGNIQSLRCLEGGILVDPTSVNACIKRRFLLCPSCVGSISVPISGHIYNITDLSHSIDVASNKTVRL